MKELIGFEERAIQARGRKPSAMRARRRGAFLRLWRGENGQSLAEAALTFPIMALVILGIFQAGIVFNDYLELTNAVSQGANYLQGLRTSNAIGTDPCAATFTAISNAASLLTASKIKVTVNLNTNNGTTDSYTETGPPGSSGFCKGDQSQLAQNQPASVTASYPVSLLVYGKNYMPNANISQTVTVYVY